MAGQAGLVFGCFPGQAGSEGHAQASAIGAGVCIDSARQPRQDLARRHGRPQRRQADGHHLWHRGHKQGAEQGRLLDPAALPLWLYQRGAPEGPALMLQILRGEEVDWELYREARAMQGLRGLEAAGLLFFPPMGMRALQQASTMHAVQ